MLNLSPRQQSILNRIVETHIETAQPVGSRFLTDLYTDLYRSSYSSATVRAEMGQLEDKGYLTHPHTSAGRVPTDRGYRFYVDHGLKEETPSEEMLSEISRELTRAKAAQRFAEMASRILSQVTHEVSLVVMTHPSHPENHQLFYQGSSRMLEKPEFQDVNRVRPILETLEEKESIAQWLQSRTAKQGVSVTIGVENESETLQHCSIIATRYGTGEKSLGTMAVLGPRRMKYSKTLPLLTQMARAMRRILENTEEMDDTI